MPREDVDTKGRRLLQEGRLRIRLVTEDERVRFPIVAQCRGDSAQVYALGFDRQIHDWHCDCPARGRCSHIVALQLCVLEPKPGTGGRLPNDTVSSVR